ncbi:MAG TPA: CBS domain-containing protein, partial [Candidatus Binatus sp.]|nr:CBS domain-containing protein [Candidatus Binatus sp.]
MIQNIGRRAAEETSADVESAQVIGPTEVADIMTGKVATLSPHNNFSEAANLMNDRYFRHCVVVDAHGQVVG